MATWAICERNAPKLLEGQTAEFALKFFSEDGLHPTDLTEPSCIPLGRGRYRIVAETIYNAEGCWVLDFGLRACRKLTSFDGVPSGVMVGGVILLSLESSSYIEEISCLPGMIPLVYTWQIDRIDVDDHWEHLFQCTLLDAPPKYTSATANGNRPTSELS